MPGLDTKFPRYEQIPRAVFSHAQLDIVTKVLVLSMSNFEKSPCDCPPKSTRGKIALRTSSKFSSTFTIVAFLKNFQVLLPAISFSFFLYPEIFRILLTRVLEARGHWSLIWRAGRPKSRAAMPEGFRSYAQMFFSNHMKQKWSDIWKVLKIKLSQLEIKSHRSRNKASLKLIFLTCSFSSQYYLYMMTL